MKKTIDSNETCKKVRKPCFLIRLMAAILQGVAIRSIGSWGAFMVDENGNFIEDYNEL